MSDLDSTLQLGCRIVESHNKRYYLPDTEVLNSLQNGFEHGTSVQNSFVISDALCVPLRCSLCVNAQVSSPIYLLRASLLVCAFTHCIILLLPSPIALMFLNAFTIFSITGGNYIVLAKNYVVVV